MATGRVRQAYRRIAQAERPEAWIQLRDEDAALAEATEVDERLAAGEPLALAGATLAVKDNIDVAGLPTTAACPAFAYIPGGRARGGATESGRGVVIGKTTSTSSRRANGDA